MKKQISVYCLITLVVLIAFIVALFYFKESTFVDISFWFGIMFLILAFLTKRDKSALPFGSTGDIGRKSPESTVLAFNAKLASRNLNSINKYEEYKKEDIKVSLLFFGYGMVFMAVSIFGALFI